MGQPNQARKARQVTYDPRKVVVILLSQKVACSQAENQLFEKIQD